MDRMYCSETIERRNGIGKISPNKYKVLLVCTGKIILWDCVNHITEFFFCKDLRNFFRIQVPRKSFVYFERFSAWVIANIVSIIFSFLFLPPGSPAQTLASNLIIV